MKQTKSAITFLMAQYRSIFSKAYFKGLVPAVALTAGLAAGTNASAAATVSGGDAWDSPAAGTVTEESTHDSSKNYFTDLNINSGSLTVANASSTEGVFVKGTLKVGQGTTLTVGNGTTKGTILNFDGDNSSSGSLDSYGTIKMSGTSVSSQIQMTNVTLRSGSVTTIQSTSSTDWDGNSQLVAGISAPGAFNIESGATVNLNDYSQIVTGKDSTMAINGTVNLTAEAASSNAFIRAADIYDGTKGEANPTTGSYSAGRTNGTITIGSTGKIVVKSGSGNAGLFAAEVNINGTNNTNTIEVQDGGELVLNGDMISKDVTFANAKYAAGQFNMASGKIYVAQGGTLEIGAGKYKNDNTETAVDETTLTTTLSINGGSLDTYGTVNVSGILSVSQSGSLNLQTDGKLNVTGSAKVNQNGTVNVLNNSTLSGAGSLEVAQNGTINIKSGANLSVSGTLSLAAGSSLNNQGTLTLSTTGKTSVDVANINHIDDLGTVVNSGTITFSTTDENANTFNIDGQEDLSLLLNNDDGSYHGEIILTGTTLESSNALALSQAELTQFQGSTNGTIHAEEVTYTVETDENLQGVTVFGDSLTFTNAAGTGDVTVSGSQATQNFVTYNLGANADSSLLVSGNAAIKMVNQGNADQSGSITTALTVSGGSLTVSGLEVKAAKDITVGTGTLTVSGSEFATALDIDGQLNLTETGSNVDVTNGSLSLKSINVTNGSLEVTNGTLSIKGDGSGGSTGTVDIIGGDKIKVTTGQLNFGDANDTVKLSLSNNDSGTWSIDQTYSGSKIKIDGATVQVDVSKALGQETTSLSITAANTLLGYLVSGTGLVDLGSTTVELPTPDKNGELTAESIADDAGNITVSFENDQTKDIIVTDLKGTITGGWEGVKTDGTNNPVQVAANAKFALYGNASGENIVTDSTGKVVGLTLGKASTTEISSTGLVGKIDGSSGDLILTDSANITVVNTSDTTKKDNVIVKKLAGTGTLNAAEIKTTDTALEQGAVVAAANYTVQKTGSFAVNGATVAVTDTLDLSDVDTAKGPAQTSGSLITAKVVEVSEAAFNDGSVVSGETLSGRSGSVVTASASTLTFNTAELENLSLVDDAEAFFETLKINNDKGVLAVGSDGDENTEASSAKAQIQSLTLNGGLLQVDPSFNQPTAMVTIDSFTSGIKDTNYETSTDDVGLADGSIFVGQNSAVGLGVKTLNELQSVISKYQVGTALDQDKYGAVLYVDGALQLDTGYGVTLTSQSLTAFENSITNSTLGFNAQNVVENAIYFGKNTALIINGDNLKDGQAFIIINGDSTDGTPSKLIAAGGEVVINGDVKAGKTTIFKTNDTDKLQVTTTDNKAGGSILVTTENNLLQGSISNDSTGITDGSVDLRVNEEEAETIINAASGPVLETILAYGRGYNGEPDADGNVAADNYLYDLDRKGNKIDYNNYFLQQELIRGNGSSTEKVARLGIYGGSAQAALSAGATTHESVSARMGMGAQNSSLTFADNSQGAGLWLNPIYKSHDSDGFGAQGLSYGTDMSLYGLALGGDFTMANGLRIGAAFNLGSGDADGQGAAAGVSNDFDYYGLTVYGGFSQGPISVVGDISYTAVDNTVDANTAFEQVHTSLDSTNLSVGVTGQYALNFNGTSITPHAGLRYTMIDLDDYVVKGSAEIAEYNGDSMSVVSIPVGVTVAKEFTAGTWTVKPSFDLTLTANMGDDSIGGSVDWTGVENLKTNLDSEVVDSFTYGATLGVAAKSGNFSLGLGVNYTGASNADEYGVQANARFVF